MIATLLLAAAAGAAPIVVPARDAVICRTERVTGTRLTKRTCKSATDQARDDAEARARMRLGGNKTQASQAFVRGKGE